jgi:hypothetical protein
MKHQPKRATITGIFAKHPQGVTKDPEKRWRRSGLRTTRMFEPKATTRLSPGLGYQPEARIV